MSTQFEQLKKEQEKEAAEKAALNGLKPGDEDYQEPAPAADPPTPAPTPAGDSINDDLRSQIQSELLSNIFGEGVNDVASAKERYMSTQSKVDELTQSNQALQESFGKTVNPFASESIRQYNQFVEKTGIENPTVFNLVSNAKEEMIDQDPIGLLVQSRIIEEPYLVGKDSTVRKMVREDLGLPDDEDDELNEIQQLRLQSKAKQAYGTISKQKEYLTLEAMPTPEDILGKRTQEINATKEAWKPIMEQMKQKEKSLSLGEGDSAFKFEYADQQVNEVVDSVLDSLAKSGKKPNEENLKEALFTIRTGLKTMNFDTAVKAFGRYTRSLEEEAFDKFYHNPSSGSAQERGPKPTPIAPEKSPAEQAAEFRKQRK